MESVFAAPVSWRAGTDSERHVVETEGVCRIHGKRPAKPHAAVKGELAPALQQQPYDLEKVLVPPDGDAILRDAAEARHDALIQRLVEHTDIADRLERHPIAARIDA